MTEVYRDGFVHVRAEPCANCLIGKDRLVDAERARRIIASTRDREAGNFVCHRSQVSDEPEAICRRWYEAFADENWVLRLARHEGMVKYV